MQQLQQPHRGVLVHIGRYCLGQHGAAKFRHSGNINKGLDILFIGHFDGGLGNMGGMIADPFNIGNDLDGADQVTQVSLQQAAPLQ